MGGSGVTALGNGERQTSGQWRRGNRAGSPGLEPAKGLATGDGHQGTLRRELKAADASTVESGRLRDSAETLRRGHGVRRPLKPWQGWRLGWRDGGMEGWRDGGMEGWRDGG